MYVPIQHALRFDESQYHRKQAELVRASEALPLLRKEHEARIKELEEELAERNSIVRRAERELDQTRNAMHFPRHEMHARRFWILFEQVLCLATRPAFDYTPPHFRFWCDGCFHGTAYAPKTFSMCPYLSGVGEFYLCSQCTRTTRKLYRIYMRYARDLRVRRHLPRPFPSCAVYIIRAYVSASIEATEEEEEDIDMSVSSWSWD